MKKKYVLLFAVVLFIQSVTTYCQENTIRGINVNGGVSYSGTGDIIGPIFCVEYIKPLKRNWFISYGLGATIHSETGIPVFFNYNNQTIDATIHETNAGIQAISHIGYFFVNSSNSVLGVKTGAVLRYQSTSSTAIITALFPAATNLPYPVYVYENVDPQNTFATGLSGQVYYTYRLNKKLGIGLLGGFQFDSNGDNISQLSLSLTRFLK